MSLFGIHLNPIRAGVVADLKALDHYSYSGHSRLTGKLKRGFQGIQTVLSRFGKTRREAPEWLVRHSG